MSDPRPDLEILPDAGALAARAAAWFADILAQTPGRIAVCLSGGSTPKPLYELLATPPWRARLPWPRIHWFLGDERFVPEADARSNLRMVRAALLARAPVPAANVHGFATTGLTPVLAAQQYAAELQQFYGHARLQPDKPLFDVNFLGLGEDGHTASLFPGDAALDERDRWACAVVGVKPEARLTLTRPVLESARHAAFLVAGAAKQPALARLRAGDPRIPAGGIRPMGELRIFADAAAAGGNHG